LESKQNKKFFNAGRPSDSLTHGQPRTPDRRLDQAMSAHARHTLFLLYRNWLYVSDSTRFWAIVRAYAHLLYLPPLRENHSSTHCLLWDKDGSVQRE